MTATRIQVFIITLVATSGIGATIAFCMRSLPAMVPVSIAVGVGLLAGGSAAWLIRDPGQKTLEALQDFHKQECRGAVNLSGETALENEFVSILSDMSGKLQASNEEFQRKCREYNFCVEFSKVAATVPSQSKLLSLVLDKVSHHVGSKSCAVLLLDGESDKLITRAVRGDNGGLTMGQRVPTSEGVYSQVLQSGKAVIQRKGVRDRALSRITQQGPSEDVACIPLQVGNRALGILDVHGKKDDTGFSQDDSEFLSFVGNGTAMVLKQALLQDELTKIFLSIVKAMVQAVDARDRYTRNHSTRVSEYSRALARALKYQPDQLDGMLFGSLLHDIGKLGVPDDILNKPGKLSTEEFEVIKSHTVRGVEILAHLETQLPWNILPMVRSHHERWDGRGYPDGLNSEHIEYNARVVALADFFDAITSDRVYRPGMPLQTAIMEIRRGVSTHFDPKLVPVATEVLSGEYDRIAKTIGLG